MTTCQLPAQRSDATIIADSILQRESDDPLLDPERRAELSGELERVLSLIRGSHPAVMDVHARDPYAPGRLVVGLTPTLRATVEFILGDQEGSVVLETGSEAFDTLNRQLGLRGVELHSRPRHAILCFDDHLNAPIAAGAYSALEEVRYADPDYIVGDGPDVDALRDGNTWYVVFRDAWGDCPAGCIHEKLFFFTVTDDEVVKVEPSEALVDPRFQELIRWVRHREGSEE